MVVLQTNGPIVARKAARAYTEIILGLPILVLLYLIYFVLPQIGVRIGEVAAGLLTLTLYYSPYMAEAIRGAIASVPSGQIDAARMVGLSPFRIFSRILLPQTLGLMIPPLTGIMIGLAKDTAILSVISVHELAYVTKRVVSRTYAPFEVWALVAAIYWISLTALELLSAGWSGGRPGSERQGRWRERRGGCAAAIAGEGLVMRYGPATVLGGIEIAVGSRRGWVRRLIGLCGVVPGWLPLLLLFHAEPKGARRTGAEQGLGRWFSLTVASRRYRRVPSDAERIAHRYGIESFKPLAT